MQLVQKQLFVIETEILLNKLSLNLLYFLIFNKEPIIYNLNLI